MTDFGVPHGSLSWDSFLNQIASRHRNGESDRAISASLMGARVRLVGEIHSVTGLKEGEVHGVSLGMFPVELELGDGWRALVDYAFVNVEDVRSGGWEVLFSSQRVEVMATVSSGSAIFPAIEISKDPEVDLHREAVILMGFDRGELIKIL